MIKNIHALKPLYRRYPMEKVAAWLVKRRFSMCGTIFSSLLLANHEITETNDEIFDFTGTDEFQLNTFYVTQDTYAGEETFAENFGIWFGKLMAEFLDIFGRTEITSVMNVCANCDEPQPYVLSKYKPKLVNFMRCKCLPLTEVRDYYFSIDTKTHESMADAPSISVLVRITASNRPPGGRYENYVPRAEKSDESWNDSFWNEHHVMWYGNELQVEPLAERISLEQSWANRMTHYKKLKQARTTAATVASRKRQHEDKKQKK